MCQRCKRDNRVLRAGGACKTRRVKLQEVGSKRPVIFSASAFFANSIARLNPKVLSGHCPRKQRCWHRTGFSSGGYVFWSWKYPRVLCRAYRWNGIQQGACVIVLWLGKDAFNSAAFNDATILHHQNAVCQMMDDAKVVEMNKSDVPEAACSSAKRSST